MSHTRCTITLGAGRVDYAQEDGRIALPSTITREGREAVARMLGWPWDRMGTASSATTVEQLSPDVFRRSGEVTFILCAERAEGGRTVWDYACPQARVTASWESISDYSKEGASL